MGIRYLRAWMLAGVTISLLMIAASLPAGEIESGFVDVSGGKLYYEKQGAGEAVVFLHDGLMHREVWDYQFDKWADRYTVIRYDRRWFGESPASTEPYSDVADLEAVIDTLGIEKTILAGMSAGGRLAIDFTLAHPSRVTQLILVGPAVSGMSFTDHFLSRGGHLIPGVYTDPKLGAQYWAFDDPYEIYSGNPAVKARAHALLAKYPNDILQMTDRFRQPVARPALGHLDEIQVPTLLMAGEYDAPDMHAHLGVLAVGIPHAQRVILKDCAHRAVMEQPEQIDEAVRVFQAETRFYSVLEADGIEAAARWVERKLAADPEVFLFREAPMNMRGYVALLGGETEKAVGLFKLNVLAHPESANVYDSYGEALLAVGDTVQALTNYQKSLELNPDNANAAHVIQEIVVKR